jgi:hypothetical protein
VLAPECVAGLYIPDISLPGKLGLPQLLAFALSALFPGLPRSLPRPQGAGLYNRVNEGLNVDSPLPEEQTVFPRIFRASPVLSIRRVGLSARASDLPFAILQGWPRSFPRNLTSTGLTHGNPPGTYSPGVMCLDSEVLWSLLFCS